MPSQNCFDHCIGARGDGIATKVCRMVMVIVSASDLAEVKSGVMDKTLDSIHLQLDRVVRMVCGY